MSADIVRVRVRGTKACYTRPEHKTDRLSSSVPTHAAMRSILEAYHWKPEFHYRVIRVEFVRPVQFWSRVQNEVKIMPGPTPTKEGDFTQRRTTFVVDPDYVVTARVCPFESGGSNLMKHVNEFKNNVRRGRFFQDVPYLGMREWMARVDLAEDKNDASADASVNLRPADIGLVEFDRFGYFRCHKSPPAFPKYLFTRVEVKAGVMEMPAYESVERDGICIGGAS